MNEFEKVYNQIVREMLIDLRENLQKFHVIEDHAITNTGKIYMGGLTPIRKIYVESDIID